MTTTPDPIAAIERALEGVDENRWTRGEFIADIVIDMSVPPHMNGAVVCEASSLDIAAYIAACNPVAITALLALARQAAEKDAEIARLRRLATDRKYMLEAYRNMLGPKGLEVATMWERQGVTRQHTSWGPDAYSLSGEERAQVLLDVQTAVSVPLDFNDGGLPTVDVRALTTETSDAQ